uniref:Uncharacterized protein n=1 Tax=Arundo donax TaxID=35708 RepID=A0A0A9AQ52_ARUDO
MHVVCSWPSRCTFVDDEELANSTSNPRYLHKREQ